MPVIIIVITVQNGTLLQKETYRDYKNNCKYAVITQLLRHMYVRDYTMIYHTYVNARPGIVSYTLKFYK